MNQETRCPTCGAELSAEGTCFWCTGHSTPQPLAPESAKKQWMKLPENSAYPNFNEVHEKDAWCAKAGCTPVCEKDVISAATPEQPVSAAKPMPAEQYFIINRLQGTKPIIWHPNWKASIEFAEQYALCIAKWYEIVWSEPLRHEIAALKEENERLRNEHNLHR